MLAMASMVTNYPLPSQAPKLFRGSAKSVTRDVLSGGNQPASRPRTGDRGRLSSCGVLPCQVFSIASENDDIVTRRSDRCSPPSAWRRTRPQGEQVNQF